MHHFDPIDEAIQESFPASDPPSMAPQAPSPVRRTATVPRGDFDMVYDTMGHGEPILFLHAFLMRASMWHDVAAYLDHVESVMPDFRGHGRTDIAEVTIGRLADDVVALLDERGYSRVTLCGSSLGSLVALEVYRRHRERVRALVLSGCRPDAESQEQRQGRMDLARRVLRSGASVAVDAIGPKLFGPAIDDERATYWREVMGQTRPEGAAATLHALAEHREYGPLLPKVTVPTLLAYGLLDRISIPAIATSLFVTIPNSRVELIAQAGHLAPVEKPEAFAAVIQQFMNRLKNAEHVS